MEKEVFIDVLKHYANSSESEAIDILLLKENFPYSQVLHSLSAKLGKDHQLGEEQKALQSAAVYAADRSVLKSVMNGEELIIGPVAKPAEWRPRGQYLNGMARENGHTFGDADNGVLNFGQQVVTEINGFEEEDIHKIATDTAAPEQSPSIEEIVSQEAPPHIPVELKGSFDYGSLAQKPTDAEAGSVADEIMTDLERLNQLKHDFEVLYAATKIEQQSANELSTPAASVSVSTYEPEIESKVERLIEMDSALDHQPQNVPSTPKPSLLRRKFGANEALIDEIVNRKEIEPESNKQREQLEMIDQFIKTQPSISPGKDRTDQTDGDLSTIKSGEFTDNIVSETLVEILVKQGKKDKAIEVLKKLIWKFPQKKAYFAAQ
ncbi:MAG: hypothetical protein ABI477_17140, partial [Chryseolinea sp.]